MGVGVGGVAVEAHFLAQAVAGHFDAFVGYVHKGRYLLAAETHLEVAGEAHIGWRELRIALAQALCVVTVHDVEVAVEGVLVVVVADVFLDGNSFLRMRFMVALLSSVLLCLTSTSSWSDLSLDIS